MAIPCTMEQPTVLPVPPPDTSTPPSNARAPRLNRRVVINVISQLGDIRGSTIHSILGKLQRDLADNSISLVQVKKALDRLLDSGVLREVTKGRFVLAERSAGQAQVIRRRGARTTEGRPTTALRSKQSRSAPNHPAARTRARSNQTRMVRARRPQQARSAATLRAANTSRAARAKPNNRTAARKARHVGASQNKLVKRRRPESPEVVISINELVDLVHHKLDARLGNIFKNEIDEDEDEDEDEEEDEDEDEVLDGAFMKSVSSFIDSIMSPLFNWL